MSETMNDFEKQLLEELKFNVSSDSLRRKKKDNAEIRALSLVRHNCVDWLKIDKKETVLDLGGTYGDLCGSIAPRCRKLYILPIDEAHQAIIEERIKALKNAETADIEEILNNKKIKINRAIIHDLPLVFKDREELFEMISTLMDKGIGKIAVLCDCPESWRSHLNISMKNKEKDEIRKRYSDLCLIPEEVTAGIRMPEGYHKAVFSALPDNTFVRAVAKENADTYEGTSFTMLLEKEETPYDEVYRRKILVKDRNKP